MTLGGAGYRRGGARRRVIELLGGEDCALTAQEIDDRLEEVGRASVYRAIEQLAELRLVSASEVGGDASAYERVHPAGDHHHHIVCERCGRVVPFEDHDLEMAIKRVSRKRRVRRRRPRGDPARHLRPLLQLRITPTRWLPAASRRCRGRRG